MVDVKAYLPNYEYVTIYFLKDLIEGKKKVSNRQATSPIILTTLHIYLI